jgi:hypothetical protein
MPVSSKRKQPAETLTGEDAGLPRPGLSLLTMLLAGRLRNPGIAMYKLKEFWKKKATANATAKTIPLSSPAHPITNKDLAGPCPMADHLF